MKPYRFVLTGMQKGSKAASSPVLLHWQIDHPDKAESIQCHYPHYEKFCLFRLTEAAFKRLQKRGIKQEGKLNAFTIRMSASAKNLPVLCTDAEFVFAEACKLVTLRGVVAIRWISKHVSPVFAHPQP